MIEFKGSHFERDVILWGVRWYVAYPIGYRQLEEMMEERGVEVDHSTLKRLAGGNRINALVLADHVTAWFCLVKA
jgi:transposase-like protein